MDHFWKKRDSQKLLIAIIVAAFGIGLYVLLQHMDFFSGGVGKLVHIMFPFIIGGVVAYIVDPICDKLDLLFFRWFSKTQMPENKQKKLAKSLSIAITLILLLALIVLMLALIIPQLVSSIRSLVNNIPVYAEEAYNIFYPFIIKLGLQDWFDELNLTQTIINWAKDTLLPNANTIWHTVSTQLGNLFTVLYNLIIGFIVSFYCLNYRDKFALQGKKALFAVFSFRWAKEILDRLRFANKAFSGFISGKIIASLIIGVIAFIGCVILRMPYSPLIAVIIGVTNVIPFFGPIIGAVPCAFLILMENPLKALYFIIFIILLQQFDSNILSPRILSSSVGVSGFWILFSIMLFGGLFGVVGMVIGTPLFAVIYSIIRDCVNSALAKKALPSEAWHYSDLDDFERQYAPDVTAMNAAAAYFSQTVHDPEDDLDEDTSEE